MRIDLDPAAEEAIRVYIAARNVFSRTAFLAHVSGKPYEAKGAATYAKRIERAIEAERLDPDPPGLKR